jgi:hypothetical protein
MIALVLILNLADGAACTGTWKGRISDLKRGAMVDAGCHRRCIEEHRWTSSRHPTLISFRNRAAIERPASLMAR